MLDLELAGQSYVKTEHNARLRTLISRSKAAVEFKHRNISAVLRELGMPTIRGYTPALNYQGALFEAIDRYLSAHGANFDTVPRSPDSGTAELSLPFEAPAPATNTAEDIPDGLKRLLRKFDPVERDFRNRALGEWGERLIVELEKHRLQSANLTRLAEQVRWVSKLDGDGAGYDVHSFDESGADRLIEVKTTRCGPRTPFYLTRNELALSREQPNEFRIYRLYDFDSSPAYFTITPPLEATVILRPDTWKAAFE